MHLDANRKQSSAKSGREVKSCTRINGHLACLRRACVTLEDNNIHGLQWSPQKGTYSYVLQEPYGLAEKNDYESC